MIDLRKNEKLSKQERSADDLVPSLEGLLDEEQFNPRATTAAHPWNSAGKQNILMVSEALIICEGRSNKTAKDHDIRVLTESRR